MRGCATDPAAVQASILSALLVLTSTGPLDLCRSAVSCMGGWVLVPLDDSTAVRYDQFGITPLFTTFGVRCDSTFFVTSILTNPENTDDEYPRYLWANRLIVYRYIGWGYSLIGYGLYFLAPSH